KPTEPPYMTLFPYTTLFRSLSTVYRNLNILEENDLLLKTADIDGISYYQINKGDHKHFITCSNCHKKFLIKSCPVHELEKEVERSEEHTSELQSRFDLVCRL